MILKKIEVGPLGVNCYIVGDEKTKEAAVVDPGGDVDAILALLKKEGLTCRQIINTHAHFDHVGGNARLKEATGADILTHPDEASSLAHVDDAAKMFGINSENSPPADKLVTEGDIVEIGEIKARIAELHGHSPCGIALIFDEEKLVIVGDTLFAGSIGRTDFPGGSYDALIQDIQNKLFTLPDETVVLPGHLGETTIGREKRHNPFFS